MKIKLLPSILVFLGSYFPLAIILFAQDFKYSSLKYPLCWSVADRSSGCEIPLSYPVFSISIILVCIISFFISLAVLYSSRPKYPVNIVDAKYIPAELMSYTLPYVVSFMSIGYQDIGKFIGFAVFLFWMFLVTYRSGQIILNPLLVVFGWRLYEVSYQFPGDTVVRNGRALASGYLEPNNSYPHAIVQDVIVLKVVQNSEG